jgi:hypothetical protein
MALTAHAYTGINNNCLVYQKTSEEKTQKEIRPPYGIRHKDLNIT